MTAKPESSSRPADAGFAIAATLVAVVLFLVGWGVLHRGFYTHDPIVDTPVYERYGSQIDDGKLPYRDFALEYPPGALPVFAVPALGDAGSETFRVRFEALMAFFGEAMIVCVAIALVALGAGRTRLVGALGFVALAPLALGPVVLSRFDLWPAALVAAALAALVSGRLRLGHVALGAAIAAKLYPVVLAPVAVAYVWRRKGRREALVCAAALAAVVGLVFAPFLVLAPGRRSGTACGTRLLARFRSRASARASSWSPITCSGPRSRWSRATARRTSPGRRRMCSRRRSRCSRRRRS